MTKNCQQIALRELDGLRVIDAKYEGKILMVVAVDKGQYNRFSFMFKDNWTGYDVTKKENITYTGLNFTVLDNGVCIHIDEDENIEIFNKLSKVKIINDSSISYDINLYHKGATTMFIRENAIYSIAMKKP
jgi:hypothetical protein